jgi:hypothetical protein
VRPVPFTDARRGIARTARWKKAKSRSLSEEGRAGGPVNEKGIPPFLGWSMILGSKEGESGSSLRGDRVETIGAQGCGERVVSRTVLRVL